MKTWLLLSSIILTSIAFAETQLYGTISSGITASQSRFADGKRLSNSKIEDYGSYIGMRGRIPLNSNSGTHTIWQWEQSSPTSPSFRDTWRTKKENRNVSPHLDFTQSH